MRFSPKQSSAWPTLIDLAELELACWKLWILRLAKSTSDFPAIRNNAPSSTIVSARYTVGLISRRRQSSNSKKRFRCVPH